MEKWKEKNLAAVFGGMTALLGMFLPYVADISFFQSLSGPKYGFFAPWLTLMIAFTTILYALGLDLIPLALSIDLFLICLAFPGYACWAGGVGAVLTQLRFGAWVLLGGSLLMAVSPFFKMAACGRKTPNT